MWSADAGSEMATSETRGKCATSRYSWSSETLPDEPLQRVQTRRARWGSVASWGLAAATIWRPLGLLEALTNAFCAVHSTVVVLIVGLLRDGKAAAVRRVLNGPGPPASVSMVAGTGIWAFIGASAVGLSRTFRRKPSELSDR